MARPRIELPAAQEILALIDPEGRFAVRVTPGARSEAVSIEAERLLVKIRAKPQDGAANEAVIKLLARALGIAPSKLNLLRGAASREKLLQIAP